MPDPRDSFDPLVDLCLVFVVGLLLTLMGCAPLTLEQQLAVRAESTRVCIRNETAAMGDLRGWADGYGRRWTVMGGDEECELFSAVGVQELRVYVETIGGSAWGPTRAAAVFPLRPGACWDWVVRNDMSSGAVLPCREGSSKWGL